MIDTRQMKSDIKHQPNLSTTDFTPRSYQLELLSKSKKKNTIAFLNTGTGKTYIAILLIKEKSKDIRIKWEEGGKRTFFIVNSVPLVYQQGNYVREHTDLKVGQFTGSMSVDFWKEDQWESQFRKYEVLVMTAQIFLNILNHGFLKLSKVNLIVFDECHHAIKNHPYKKIMELVMDETFCESNHRPHILGLTASVINNKCHYTKVGENVKHLELVMNSSVETSLNYEDIYKYSTKPKEMIYIFELKAHPFHQWLDKYVISLLNSSIKTLVFYGLKDNLGKEFAADDKEEHRNRLCIHITILKQLINIALLYGPWCALMASKILAKDLHKMQARCEELDIKDAFSYIASIVNNIIIKLNHITNDTLSMKELLLLSTSKLQTLVKILELHACDDADEKNNKTENKTKEKKNNFTAIIFVETRFTAIILNLFLNTVAKLSHKLSFIKSGYIIGHGMQSQKKMCEAAFMLHKSQQDVLTKFRRGELNILIGTKVIEEGIDIPKCNLVIRFDLPQNFRSYVQSKGRARAENSHFLLMVADAFRKTLFADLRDYSKIETSLSKNCNNRSGPAEEESIKFHKLDELLPPYQPEFGEGKPRVTMTSAIALVNWYCSRLPSDAFTKFHPHCKTRKIEIQMKPSTSSQPKDEKSESILQKPMPTIYKYQTTLKLPINSVLKMPIMGQAMDCVKTAQMATALKCCEMLHQAGELDDHLLPLTKESYVIEREELAETVPDGTPLPGSTKRKQLYFKKIAQSLKSAIPVAQQKCYLYAMDMHLNVPTPKILNTHKRRLYHPENYPKTLAILTRNPIPLIPVFPLYTRAGEIVITKRLISDDVILEESQLTKLINFHEYIFHKVLRITTKNIIFDMVSAPYNILITIIDESDQEMEKYNWIDFNYMDYVFAKDSESVVDLKDSNRPPFEFNKKDFMDSVVTPIYRHFDRPMYFFVAEILTSMTPLSPFPNNANYATSNLSKSQPQISENTIGEDVTNSMNKVLENVTTKMDSKIQTDVANKMELENIDNQAIKESNTITHETFESYYKTKYGICLTNKTQNLLDVDHTVGRLNLLTPRFMTKQGTLLPTSSTSHDSVKATKRKEMTVARREQMLVPELCRIHPFSSPLWHKTVCLPALLHRLNYLLVCDELRIALAQEAGLGPEQLDNQNGDNFPSLDFGWGTLCNEKVMMEEDYRGPEIDRIEPLLYKIVPAINRRVKMNGSTGDKERPRIEKIEPLLYKITTKIPDKNNETTIDKGIGYNDSSVNLHYIAGDSNNVKGDDTIISKLDNKGDGNEVTNVVSDKVEICFNGHMESEQPQNDLIDEMTEISAGLTDPNSNKPSNQKETENKIGVKLGEANIVCVRPLHYKIEKIDGRDRSVDYSILDEWFDNAKDELEGGKEGWRIRNLSTESNKQVGKNFGERVLENEFITLDISPNSKKLNSLDKKSKQTSVNSDIFGNIDPFNSMTEWSLSEVQVTTTNKLYALNDGKDANLIVNPFSPHYQYEDKIYDAVSKPSEVNTLSHEVENDLSSAGLYSMSDFEGISYKALLEDDGDYSMQNGGNEEDKKSDISFDEEKTCGSKPSLFASFDESSDSLLSDECYFSANPSSPSRQDNSENSNLSTDINKNSTGETRLDTVVHMDIETKALVNMDEAFIKEKIRKLKALEVIDATRSKQLDDKEKSANDEISFLPAFLSSMISKNDLSIHYIIDKQQTTTVDLNVGTDDYSQKKSNLLKFNDIYAKSRKKHKPYTDLDGPSKDKASNDLKMGDLEARQDLETDIMLEELISGNDQETYLKKVDREPLPFTERDPRHAVFTLNMKGGFNIIPRCPDLCLLLRAITMSTSNDALDLERLELIGDSFLKMAVTVYLFCSEPTCHEGKLSYKRSKQVSNFKLYHLGKIRGVGEMLISAKFEPLENWLAPGYKLASQQVKCDENVLNTGLSKDAHPTPEKKDWKFDPSKTCPEITDVIPYDMRTEQMIPDKCLADCVESLIGAYLISCGARAALDFMKWLGIQILCSSSNDEEKLEESKSSVICENDEDIDKIWANVTDHLPPSPLIISTPNYNLKIAKIFSNLERFEDVINYKFNDPAYLIQALTHSSYGLHRLTDCYQRLEFLGDALLDYLITRHLYNLSDRFTPGQMTDLRSALVNNIIFASLAVKFGFHKFLLQCSPKLFGAIDRFVKVQREKKFGKDTFNMGDNLLIWCNPDNQHTHSPHYVNSPYQEGKDKNALNQKGESVATVQDIEVPKVLGDIFESVAGAIFMDSGMSLKTLWRVYSAMMRDEIEYYTKNLPISPIRELLESEPDRIKFMKPMKLVSGQVKVTVEVFGKGRWSGVGSNCKIAKCTAAKTALHFLKIKATSGKK
ncbi:unnamed protein product [Gordionus sp. m RMFG-2023]|uniref:endoribonuclease Dicer-like n=1 Tax=Gordionus sp. m RMFG-2023 TaxID=3053472 RepID=UPI0030E457E7